MLRQRHLQRCRIFPHRLHSKQLISAIIALPPLFLPRHGCVRRRSAPHHRQSREAGLRRVEQKVRFVEGCGFCLARGKAGLVTDLTRDLTGFEGNIRVLRLKAVELAVSQELRSRIVEFLAARRTGREAEGCVIVEECIEVQLQRLRESEDAAATARHR